MAFIFASTRSACFAGTNFSTYNGVDYFSPEPGICYVVILKFRFDQ